MGLTAEEKLQKARINIQRKNPFFAFLSLYLQFEEQENWDDSNSLGASIDIHGTFRYKKEFIDKLQDAELEGVIVHEILHLALLHMVRTGDRHPFISNVAQDVCVNEVLKENNFKLPEKVIWSNNNHEVELFPKSKHKQIIKKCDEKTAEVVYDEIKIPPEMNQKIFISFTGDGEGKEGQGQMSKEQQQAQKEFFEKLGYHQLDEHISTNKDGKKMSQEEREKIEREWLQKTQEAYVLAKMKGNIPAGIERLLGKLHESKINWKTLLYRFVTSYIASDYTYARPNKKSISAGYYLPDYTKDKIKVVVGVDVSGSIGQEELVDFISEVVGMAKGFRDKMDISLFTHETEVNGCWEVQNGDIAKIEKIEIKGGGGTSHIQPFEFIKEKYKECKVAVFLTDGYSDIDQIEMTNYRFNKIFVISKNGHDEQIDKSKARVISLK